MAPLDEDAVQAAAFELLFAFDEVISLGYKEHVTVQQARHAHLPTSVCWCSEPAVPSLSSTFATVVLFRSFAVSDLLPGTARTASLSILLSACGVLQSCAHLRGLGLAVQHSPASEVLNCHVVCTGEAEHGDGEP